MTTIVQCPKCTRPVELLHGTPAQGVLACHFASIAMQTMDGVCDASWHTCTNLTQLTQQEAEIDQLLDEGARELWWT